MTSSPSRKLRTLLVAAIALAVVAGAIHNELQGLQIRAVPRPGADPLSLRFAIVNPAFTVTAKDVDITCLSARLTGHGGDGRRWTARAAPFPLNVNIDLTPRAAFEYTCPIETTAGPPDRVEAGIEVRYTRFGHRKQFRAGPMMWNASSRVWMLAGR